MPRILITEGLVTLAVTVPKHLLPRGKHNDALATVEQICASIAMPINSTFAVSITSRTEAL
jgi:hypothetical protein